jgi:hypothetical protein
MNILNTETYKTTVVFKKPLSIPTNIDENSHGAFPPPF